MLEALRSAIRARRDEMARLVESLVAVPTENPPGNDYEPCLRLLAESLEKLGLDAVVEAVPGGDLDAERPRFWLRSDWGPGLLSVSHGPKEFVKRRDVEDCALVYALTAARLLS